MSDMKTLIEEVKAHDASANPGPWRAQICVDSDLIDTHSSIKGNGYLLVDDVEHADAALIAHYRTAAPILAAEVERLDLENAALGAEVRRLNDNLKSITTALGAHLRPNQTPASAITRLIGDLAACERERDAYQRERDELRLTLRAEQGQSEGAPPGWWYSHGEWRRIDGLADRYVNCCSDNEPAQRWCATILTGDEEHPEERKIWAPTAREAMKRADKAFQEKA